jgi:hypothetical protein
MMDRSLTHHVAGEMCHEHLCRTWSALARGGLQGNSFRDVLHRALPQACIPEHCVVRMLLVGTLCTTFNKETRADQHSTQT